MDRVTAKRLEAAEYWQFVWKIAGFVGEDYRAAAWKAARATPKGDGSGPLAALLSSLPVDEGRRVVASVERARVAAEFGPAAEALKRDDEVVIVKTIRGVSMADL